MRLVSQSVRAPTCDISTGRSLASATSIAVRSPQWAVSIVMPMRFIRRTTWRPNVVSPPSVGSLSPEPRALDSE